MNEKEKAIAQLMFGIVLLIAVVGVFGMLVAPTEISGNGTIYIRGNTKIEIGNNSITVTDVQIQGSYNIKTPTYALMGLKS